uniref:Uncharacterized protein n=1 Tax=Magallana gigas TaxID=29159 RepID=K1R414_MAGGI
MDIEVVLAVLERAITRGMFDKDVLDLFSPNMTMFRLLCCLALFSVAFGFYYGGIGYGQGLYNPYYESAIARLLQSAHRFRKNFKDTNVVSIGNSALKVIREEHVTRTDGQCVQRHKIQGTSRLYEFFDSNIPSIGDLHAHDPNASINTFIREEHSTT